MNNHNKTSHEEISLTSNTEDSLWKFVCCEKCEEQFENELHRFKAAYRIHACRCINV